MASFLALILVFAYFVPTCETRCIAFCTALDVKLSTESISELHDINKQILPLFVELSKGRLNVCRNKAIVRDLFVYKTAKSSKISDYTMLLMVKKFYTYVISTLTTVESKGYRSTKSKELSQQLCKMHMTLDKHIQLYEDTCDYRQPRPKINVAKYFYDFGKADCLLGKEDKLENHAKVFFHQGELLAIALNAVLSNKKSDYNISINKSKKKIVQG